MLQTSLQQAAIDRWLQHGTRCTVASFRFWPKATAQQATASVKQVSDSAFQRSCTDIATR